MTAYLTSKWYCRECRRYRNAEDFAVTRDGVRLVTRDCADCLRQLDIAHHRESKKRRLK